MLKRIYDWCVEAADKPYALWILAAVAFAESSFFPIPPDIMLLPMSLARPKRAWWFAAVCTVASVAGGVLGYAIGALLYDSLGQCGIEALLSGNPGMIAIPTVNSAVIIAAMAAGIAGEVGATPEKVFPTVVASISVASLLTGGAFLALGWFRLGNLIRYIPYPVIGGFLAGTGWLVASGAMKTMNRCVPLTMANLGQFARSEALLRWIPGVFLGLVLLLLVRRFKHYLITPVMILGATLLFYVILWVTGTTIEQATQLGLLFKPFPPGALWQPPPLGDRNEICLGRSDFCIRARTYFVFLFGLVVHIFCQVHVLLLVIHGGDCRTEIDPGLRYFIVDRQLQIIDLVIGLCQLHPGFFDPGNFGKTIENRNGDIQSHIRSGEPIAFPKKGIHCAGHFCFKRRSMKAWGNS